MATIPFNFTYVKSGNNQVLTQTAYAPPPSGDIFDDLLPYEGKLTNTKTSAVYNLSSANMTSLIKVSIDGVFGTYTRARPDFLDGVCEASITYNNFGGTLYQGKKYLLYTDNIDTWWAYFLSLQDASLTNWQTIYNTYNPIFTQITTLSSNLAANYAAINTLIGQIETAMASGYILFFNSTVNYVSPTTVQLASSVYSPNFDIEEQYVTVYNTKIVANKIYATSLNIAAVGSKTQNIVSGSPIGSPNFDDGVLQNVFDVVNVYNDYPNILLRSTSYTLITTAITASIAALPSSAIKTYLQEQLALVTTYFNATQYTDANDQITLIEFLLGYADENRANTLTKTSNSVLTNIITDALPIAPDYAYVAYSTNLTNTLTSADKDLTSLGYPEDENETTISFTSQDTFVATIYDDGVYRFRGTFLTYPIDLIGDALNNIVQSYALVTTTIDAQFLTFEANYDPSNAEQAAAHQSMLTAFATITTLSSNLAANYVAINAQIVIIQNLLALFVDVTATLTLTDKSNLLITLDGADLPSVLYSNQALTLSNTNNEAQEYILENAFPLNYVDLTQTLNSETILFGSQFDDGVYQVNISWDSDNDMTFNAQAYCLVTTQIDCGIAGVIAKRPDCKALINKLNTLMTYKRIILDSFANQDYSTTNFYINLCLHLLNSSGCNCGC
jgi:hypothetical protein